MLCLNLFWCESGLTTGWGDGYVDALSLWVW